MVEEVTSSLSGLGLEDRPGLKWRTGLVYDEMMTRHENFENPSHPETPQRILRIWKALEEEGCVKACRRIPVRHATHEEIALQHRKSHIEKMQATSEMDQGKLQRTANSYNSIYLNQFSYDCALLSLGGTLALTQEVIEGKVLNGMAVVRPPGHHAEEHCCGGFCLFNNIAIAAEWAKKFHGVEKILIVDWDVHHGNGTQHMFESDPDVLYFSIHRFDNGAFYPGSQDADYDKVGSGKGKGFNINVPWNTHGMGDGDYLAAFNHVLMPVAQEFSPDLVFVSCGFDAAMGDPLGRCRVTADGYAHMMHRLMSLADGKVVVMLEGGYNLSSISRSAVACVKILLGHVPPRMESLFPCSSALESIRNTVDALAPYWTSLTVRTGEVERAVDDKDPKEALKPKQASQPVTSEPSAAGLMGVAGALASGGTDSHKRTVGEMVRSIVSDDQATLYAVNPLSWCPHMPDVTSVPSGGINVEDPCKVCGDVIENWICLQCYQVMCSRYSNEHMVQHSAEEGHHVVLSFSDLSVWCYACDNYVHNEAIVAAKQAAYWSKFGEAMPQ